MFSLRYVLFWHNQRELFSPHGKWPHKSSRVAHGPIFTAQHPFLNKAPADRPAFLLTLASGAAAHRRSESTASRDSPTACAVRARDGCPGCPQAVHASRPGPASGQPAGPARCSGGSR